MGLIGAIEAGGTKFICAVGSAHNQIMARKTIDTGAPDETLAKCAKFFQVCKEEYGKIERLGVAAFGPLDLSSKSPNFGSLLKTPKAGWSGVNFIEYFQGALSVPVSLHTDVGAAVLAEVKWGAALGCHSAVYVTVGTGIGAGVYVNGKLLPGLIHPELGHVAVPRAEGDSGFSGVCPFHVDCVEGLASGPSMKARWGEPAENLLADHPAWDLEAFYLAQLCRTITLSLSPERIVLGGGVMAHEGLLADIRHKFSDVMGSYLPIAERTGGLDKYISGPVLGDISGLAGAFALAQAID